MQLLKRTKLINSIIDEDVEPKVKLLRGVRGCGKSTLLKQIAEELKERGIDESNIIHFSCLSIEFRKKKFMEIYDLIANKINGKTYLFFDNVESFGEWQSLLKMLSEDFDCEIYAAINYSMFFTLDRHCALAGRSYIFDIYPFSFKEFVDFQKEVVNEDKLIKEMFIDYIVYGGMPDILQYKFLNNYSLNHEKLCDVILHQDFVKNTDLNYFSLKSFLEYMVENFTLKFSKKDFDNYEYADLNCEDLYSALNILNRSSFMIKSEIFQDERKIRFDAKYYLIDHSFYNQVYYNPIWVLDKILKNIIFVELLRREYNVFFKQSKGRYVDFVCSKYERNIAIQFSNVYLNDEIIKKDISDLNSLPDYYEKYIITTSDYDFSQSGIKHLNILDFLCGCEI